MGEHKEEGKGDEQEVGKLTYVFRMLVSKEGETDKKTSYSLKLKA